eukprot:CAMPEP_0182453820 /NCGR_PEP_ID=MMETSP1319-20130603/717_1 /TAXON_ID=172717 /ORGANISM="Bolidomonas pacifica, Strain RCC208" /LENGTH=120 /DNA_ID=CAMNT_0024651775 /DNA_START=277 /DNA_END=636 /DNA_ORIENTATION=+
MALRLQVLGGYRRLMRARLVPFANDPRALSESRKELKTQFLANKDLTDAAQITELMKGVEEVEGLLRTGLVQGEVKEHDTDDIRVHVKIREENATAMDPEAINHLENMGGGELGGKEPTK